MTCSEILVSIQNNTDCQVATNVFNGVQYDWPKGARPNTNLHERVICARTEIAELSSMSSPNMTSYHLGLTMSDGSYLELSINHEVTTVDVSTPTAALVNEMCSVSGCLNKYRVERSVTGVDPWQLNIRIFEVEVDVNAQFIQQETLIQRPEDIHAALQQQQVYDQASLDPQSPLKQEVFHQNPSLPQSPIRQETFYQNPTGPQSPIRQETFDQNRSLPQSPIRQETSDQNRFTPQSPIRQETSDQNRFPPQSPILHETFDQNRVLPQSPIRHERFKQNITDPQSPTQKETFDRHTTILQTSTQPEVFDEFHMEEETLTWEYILKNIIKYTKLFIQREILEECKNYSQFITQYQEFDELSTSMEQTVL